MQIFGAESSFCQVIKTQVQHLDGEHCRCFPINKDVRKASCLSSKAEVFVKWDFGTGTCQNRWRLGCPPCPQRDASTCLILWLFRLFLQSFAFHSLYSYSWSNLSVSFSLSSSQPQLPTPLWSFLPYRLHEGAHMPSRFHSSDFFAPLCLQKLTQHATISSVLICFQTCFQTCFDAQDKPGSRHHARSCCESLDAGWRARILGRTLMHSVGSSLLETVETLSWKWPSVA